jgi:hypothetical protein
MRAFWLFRLILLLPLATQAGQDIKLSWNGCTPLCGIYRDGLQIAITDKQSFIVRGLDGRRCYTHKICSIVNSKPDQCSELKLKGSVKLIPCK